MSGKPKYTAFTIVYLAQMETELQQMRDTLAGGLLWDDISAASFEVTSALLGKINAELQRMRGTLSRGPLWDDINAAYLAVSSALRQIEADFKRVAIFRDIKNEVPSDFGSEKSAARARPTSATPRYFSCAPSQRMSGTFYRVSRSQLWYDTNAAYCAVSSALRQIEADIKAREDNLIDAYKTRE
jgi:hypothetical protein